MTNKKNVTMNEWLRTGVLRLARVHFFYALAFVAQIMLYDAWRLIPPEVVLQRWMATLAFLSGVTTVWYFAHTKSINQKFYARLVGVLIFLDILIAAFSVYSQRGMASRAVFLFAVPIIVSAVLLNRIALFTTAVFAVCAYSASAISYFVLNFNEGYKIELYGEVGFYSAMFLILAAMLSILIRFKEES